MNDLLELGTVPARELWVQWRKYLRYSLLRWREMPYLLQGSDAVNNPNTGRPVVILRLVRPDDRLILVADLDETFIVYLYRDPISLDDFASYEMRPKHDY